MSNEELVVLIQAGERDRISELWNQVERFVWQQAGRRCCTLEGLGGVTAEDLYQAGFFALLEAVESYNLTAGMSFVGWLAIHLKNAFADAAGYRTARTRKDPLQSAVSLDAPLSDDMEITIGDTIPDPSTAMEEVEERDWVQSLHAALGKALAGIPKAEREVLQARYYQGRTFEELGGERMRQLEIRALRRLRHPTRSRELRRYRFSC